MSGLWARGGKVKQKILRCRCCDADTWHIESFDNLGTWVCGFCKNRRGDDEKI